MKPALRLCYPETLQKIKHGFILNERTCLVEYAGVDNGVSHAVFERTERHGNVTRNIYSIRCFIEIHHNLTTDFTNKLERDFTVKMAECFNVIPEAIDAKNYLTALFSHFIHDGDSLPSSINQITIANAPKEIQNEVIAARYKEESALYSQPTSIFNKAYENWNANLALINIQGTRYPQAEKDELNLNSLLKLENLSPILRQLIKLWIIHQLTLDENTPLLEGNDFFNVENLEDVVQSLQNTISNNIAKLLEMSAAQRIAMAANEKHQNRFSLSPKVYNLAQRIPLLKFIVGHTSADIHKLNQLSPSILDKMRFYAGSYLNLSLTLYLFRKSAKAFSKSKAIVKKFMDGESRATSLFMGFYKLMKSLYIIMWLPFIASYFSLIGLTSIPFSLLRKTLSITFASKTDKFLTALEAIKDLYLGFIVAPIAYSLFITVGASLLGTTGIAIGGTISVWLTLITISPMLLILLPESYDDYPRWVSYNNGPWTLQTISPYESLKNDASAFALSRFVSIHAFVAGAAFVLFTSIAFGGYILNRIIKALYPGKLSETELVFQSRNFNHTTEFKKLLASLREKLEKNECSTEDNALLTSLHQCKLDSPERVKLKAYLEKRIEELQQAVEGLSQEQLANNPPDANTLRVALNLIDNEAYLPSYKLIKRLQSENLDPSLKASLDRAAAVYESPQLAAYQV